jgi:thiol-disulfide isomerase/thioredoxin
VWRSNYLHEPLGIFDIRDGGWEATAGFAAAFLYGLTQVRRLPLLRQPVLVAFVTTLLLWTAGEVAVAASTRSPGKPLPALSLLTLDGRRVELTGFAGKPTVVNLWATWCPPCRREMPLLQQAQAAHPGVNFVFVNQGESREDVVRYLAGAGLTLGNVLLDARRATGAAFQESALPTTLFFDAQGRLDATRIGALSEATLAQRLQALPVTAPGPQR